MAHKVEIIVNARPKEWTNDTISFDEVVKLAFPDLPPDPNRIFTVTYKKGKNQGSLVQGGPPLPAENGMVFDVTATNKS
jgi:hypothetical protein